MVSNIGAVPFGQGVSMAKSDRTSSGKDGSPFEEALCSTAGGRATVAG